VGTDDLAEVTILLPGYQVRKKCMHYFYISLGKKQWQLKIFTLKKCCSLQQIGGILPEETFGAPTVLKH